MGIFHACWTSLRQHLQCTMPVNILHPFLTASALMLPGSCFWLCPMCGLTACPLGKLATAPKMHHACQHSASVLDCFSINATRLMSLALSFVWAFCMPTEQACNSTSNAQYQSYHARAIDCLNSVCLLNSWYAHDICGVAHELCTVPHAAASAGHHAVHPAPQHLEIYLVGDFFDGALPA